jgi:hypothetical protein
MKQPAWIAPSIDDTAHDKLYILRTIGGTVEPKYDTYAYARPFGATLDRAEWKCRHLIPAPRTWITRRL